MKKFLLSAFAMLLALTAGAQNFTAEKSPNPLGVQAPAFGTFKAPAKANLAANQRLVGYFNTDDCDTYLGVTGITGNNKVAMVLTADDLAPYYGKKIAGVRFNLGEGETANGVFVENLKIADGQITEATSLVSSDESVTSTAGAKNTGEWHEVMFDQKVELNSSFEGLFVGYNYKQKSNNYPIGVSSKVEGPFYIYANIPASKGGNGEDWYQINSGGYGLSIQLIVEGDFAPNTVRPLEFGEFTVVKGKSKNVAVSLWNIGSKLTSIDYTIALDGKAGAEQHLDFGKDFGLGGTHSVEIPFAAASEIGKSTVTLTITKVNGEKNACVKNSATGTLYTVEKEFVKRSVAEQFTGTGCGNCPSGHVAMHNMHNLYGDQFIGIALHKFNSSDPMYNYSYDLGFTGAPQCMVNRSSGILAPYEQMPEVLKKSLNEIALAEVTVAGTFADEDTKVNATATVNSLVAGDYDIAFILTADDLTGTTTSWKQQNYFCKGGGRYNSQASMPDDLKFLWDKGSSYVETYNDVLIASSYVSSKNKATLPTLVAYGTVNSEYSLKMPTKVALKKALKHDQVYVVALLLDKKTGAIVNAGKARVTGSTGIEDVTTGTEATVVARYTVNGVQVSAPVKGVNILKMSDGTTRKVLVK